MEAIEVSVPIADRAARALKAGDEVKITGRLYTARDQAHRRLAGLITAGAPLPFEPRGEVIFYAGPTPAPPGRAIGVIGPTTSLRMDPYLEELLKRGLKGTIGKGHRSPEARAAIARYGAVYFVATGGAAAYLSRFVKGAELVAYPELGPEAIWRIEVEDFPATVAIDSKGRDLFELERAKYRRKR